MPDEVSTTTTEAVKKLSDGTVNISIEKYEDLLEKIATKEGRISSLNEMLNRARAEPPIINRTVIEKTPEMLAAEHRAWGGSLMGLGVSLFVVGAIRYKLGKS